MLPNLLGDKQLEYCVTGSAFRSKRSPAKSACSMALTSQASCQLVCRALGHPFLTDISCRIHGRARQKGTNRLEHKKTNKFRDRTNQNCPQSEYTFFDLRLRALDGAQFRLAAYTARESHQFSNPAQCRGQSMHQQTSYREQF